MRKVTVVLEIEAELRHEDTTHDQRIKDELAENIIFATTEQTYFYVVDGKEYQAPVNVTLKFVGD